MAEFWHLRIHLLDGLDQVEIYNFLKQRCEVIIMVFESHDNRPHIHCLFKETNVTKSTIIQNLLKQYPVIKGNGAYSCSKTDKMKKKKVGDDEKALQYVCKGLDVDKLPVIVGETNIDVMEYHNKYWLIACEIKKQKEEQNNAFINEKQKTKTKTWTERVCDDIQTKYQVECNTILLYTMDTRPNDLLIEQYKKAKQTLFVYFYTCMGRGAKKMNENILRDMFAGIIANVLSKDDKAIEIKALQVYKGMYPKDSP